MFYLKLIIHKKETKIIICTMKIIIFLMEIIIITIWIIIMIITITIIIKTAMRMEMGITFIKVTLIMAIAKLIIILMII